MRRLRILLVAAFALTACTSVSAQQCCLPNVGDRPEAVRLVEGIYSATLVLGVAPFVLVTGIALWLRHEWRRDDT